MSDKKNITKFSPEELEALEDLQMSEKEALVEEKMSKIDKTIDEIDKINYKSDLHQYKIRRYNKEFNQEQRDEENKLRDSIEEKQKLFEESNKEFDDINEKRQLIKEKMKILVQKSPEPVNVDKIDEIIDEIQELRYEEEKRQELVDVVRSPVSVINSNKPSNKKPNYMLHWNVGLKYLLKGLKTSLRDNNRKEVDTYTDQIFDLLNDQSFVDRVINENEYKNVKSRDQLEKLYVELKCMWTDGSIRFTYLQKPTKAQLYNKLVEILRVLPPEDFYYTLSLYFKWFFSGSKDVVPSDLEDSLTPSFCLPTEKVLEKYPENQLIFQITNKNEKEDNLYKKIIICYIKRPSSGKSKRTIKIENNNIVELKGFKNFLLIDQKEVELKDELVENAKYSLQFKSVLETSHNNTHFIYKFTGLGSEFKVFLPETEMNCEL
jgi:hypothetical protein